MYHGEDDWYWKLEDGGDFTVKSIYKKLEGVASQNEVTGEEEKQVFSQLWKSPAPSKVVAFAWKVLLNRIPTKLNLVRRNAIPPNASLNCVLCHLVEESSNHLFLHCSVSWMIWLHLQRWLDMSFITPANLFAHWMCWNGVVSRKKELKRGLRLIWHTTIWMIWNARKNVIFNEEAFRVDEIVEEIKMVSWRWSLARLKTTTCLYYEWHWNPMSCLCR